MLSRLRPLLTLATVAAVIALVAFAVDRYRNRYVRSRADMVALLPPGPSTAFFADFSLLRQAGILRFLEGSTTEQEPEYRAFVEKTGFDYTRDINLLAGEAEGAQLFFVVRGSFSWGRLRAYAADHGGACQDAICYVPATTPGRWASFLPIQANVIGLALSADRTAAYQLSPRRERKLPAVPPQPVWVKVSHQLLKHPEGLPVAAQIFAISLAPADAVVFSLSAGGRMNAPFRLQLDATCATAAKADVVRGQLYTQTKLLRAELVREHQPINPGDLTGLLASGTFRESGTRVIGEWPIYQELLRSLQQQ